MLIATADKKDYERSLLAAKALVEMEQCFILARPFEFVVREVLESYVDWKGVESQVIRVSMQADKSKTVFFLIVFKKEAGANI